MVLIWDGLNRPDEAFEINQRLPRVGYRITKKKKTHNKTKQKQLNNYDCKTRSIPMEIFTVYATSNCNLIGDIRYEKFSYRKN